MSRPFLGQPEDPCNDLWNGFGAEHEHGFTRRSWLKKAGLFVPALFAILEGKAEAQVYQSGSIYNSGQVGLGVGIGGGGGGGGGGSCPADGSPSAATTGSAAATYLTINTSSMYAGQNNWNDGGTPRTICKLGFQLSKAGGDISGITFTAYIFANVVSSTSLTLTPLAQSNGVAGNNSWSQTMVRFPMITPFLTTANANYGLVLYGGGTVNATNLAELFHTATEQLTGHCAQWDASGIEQGVPANDSVMEIYWQ